MKKNSYIIYGVMLQKGKRIITETIQKDFCKIFSVIRWRKHHKHQRFLVAFRGSK